jgi:TetR/AcrR family transcriptional repressor of nem operon
MTMMPRDGNRKRRPLRSQRPARSAAVGIGRDHPESGCGVAGVAADAARGGSPARDSYTRQVKECLALLADLTGNPDHQAGEREAVLTLSVLVGAISMARAVDDPDLSQQTMTSAAAALKQCILP